ncbi:MAG: HAMP domain-containing histidine kinase, partial [Flavisolibacter sp.]|nr:HAMP domain-containing histidine kinase [Flavisolibacter sp.]
FANIGNRNIEQFDLHQTIDGLKDLYSTYPNVTVIWNKAEEPVPIGADRTHINRLFANLLANAVEACHKNKQCIIEINETLQEDAVLIEVKDNGDGIPAEMQPKIFTPNFTTKSSGTGLGLAMCKSIVEQADGKIWFTTTPGKGTSFFIQLPVL